MDSDYKNIYTHVSGVSYMEKLVGEKCLLHIETHSYKLKVKEQQVYHPNEMSYVFYHTEKFNTPPPPPLANSPLGNQNL